MWKQASKFLGAASSLSQVPLEIGVRAVWRKNATRGHCVRKHFGWVCQRLDQLECMGCHFDETLAMRLSLVDVVGPYRLRVERARSELLDELVDRILYRFFSCTAEQRIAFVVPNVATTATLRGNYGQAAQQVAYCIIVAALAAGR